MPIRYPDIVGLTSGTRTFGWTSHQSILYALAVGLGTRLDDPRVLRFLRGTGLVAIPTLAVTMSRDLYPTFTDMGIDSSRVVHAAQKVEFHSPVPAEARSRGTGSVTEVHDLGASRGALIVIGTTLHDAVSDRLMLTGTSQILARGDGGFGNSHSSPPARHAIPDRTPDATLNLTTRTDQALLYQLLGDRNPLHTDPESARTAGFPRTILHGLCTFGMTCCAVMGAHGGWDPARVRSHELRFSGPVFPGEALAMDVWNDEWTISFVVRAPDRNAKVIDNGRCVLAPVAST
jgi:acyl dehydratase